MSNEQSAPCNITDHYELKLNTKPKKFMSIDKPVTMRMDIDENRGGSPWKRVLTSVGTWTTSINL